MVYVKEYRIPMPLSVSEYRKAQLYMVARFSRERTSSSEGVQIVSNEPFENEKFGKGQYTHKIITAGSHLPTWAKAVLPASAVVEEKAWNAYPFVRTEYTCPFFGERFSIVSETRYYDDDGEQENVHQLSPAALKEREVEYIDIALEKIEPPYYKPEEDPLLFCSTTLQRGPLKPGWRQHQKPLMCIYKITWVKFAVWGLQTKAEQWLQKSMVRDVLTLGHKQAFCWIDLWHPLTMEDIRAYEEETKVLLDKIRSGEPWTEEDHAKLTANPVATPTATPVGTPKSNRRSEIPIELDSGGQQPGEGKDILQTAS